ncbi:polysialyltransferase family glycosyltransferase [Nonlabens sp. SY33080]|uniref:polysialyltransferase family glycosyltransferase n=1 Tax=Nonlabens sp. SY33080 TaxID=2719911 RepID=UPI001428A078|nr:polysialyltransferase family glycosyltransferase [Nonlabens sp. SY33080]
MNNNNLIITSGPSQLMIQIAAISELNYKLTDFHVLYIGVEKHRLEAILKLMCRAFKMNFIGSIDNLDNPSPVFHKPKFSLSFVKHLFYAPYRKSKEIGEIYPVLKNYRSSVVSIPYRHKMKGDVMILHHLKPNKTIITADGVVNTPTKRYFGYWEWFFIKTDLNKIPTKTKIYTPKYLKEETLKLGPVVVLDVNNMNSIRNKIRNLFISNGNISSIDLRNYKAIIFSQHLALSKVCTEDEEVNFYLKIVDYFNSQNLTPIYFKPHPRDSGVKLNSLIEKFNRTGSRVDCSKLDIVAMPIELFQSNDSTQLATANSSAPLGIGSDSNLICFYMESFRKDFKEDIINFASNNKAKLINLK